jgi:hypothetical protein
MTMTIADGDEAPTARPLEHRARHGRAGLAQRAGPAFSQPEAEKPGWPFVS